VTPTLDSQTRPEAVGSSRASVIMRPGSTRSCVGRARWRFAIGLWPTLAALFFVTLSSPFARAAGSPTAASDPLVGPWRWLEPEVVSLRLGPIVGTGPWRETSLPRDAMRRQRRIEQLEEQAFTTGRLEDEGEAGSGATLPMILWRAALDSGRLLEAVGESRGAAEAYVRVVEADPSVAVDVWHGLARSFADSGDTAGAEWAFLRGMDAIGTPAEHARMRFDLAGLYVRHGRLGEAVDVVDALRDVLPDSTPVSSSWVGLSVSLDLAARSRIEGRSVHWPEAPEAPIWSGLPAWVGETLVRLPDPVQDGLRPLTDRLRSEEGVRAVTLVGAGVAVLLALLVLLRQRGGLAIAIEYPEELRGLFRVRISGRRRSQGESASEAELRKGGKSNRSEHHMVARETHFQRLITGRYRVFVDGLLVDPATDEVLERIHEEKIVRVRHRRTVRLEFDVYPAASPVDLSIVWGDRPAEEAKVTVPGFIDRPRTPAAGRIRVLLPKGDYRLLVGCGDRVFDRPLKVDSYRPSSVELDVLAEEAVFKGCPPAVEPYLLGDQPGVARALERDGQAALAYRMLATMHQAEGEAGRAADFFESAGDLRAAARLRLEQGDPSRAATLFERAEEWLEAAEAHRLDHAVLRAGECYERALDYERAIDCYREAGAIDRWLSALERCGLVFEAAKLALDHSQRPRAIRLLQRVEATDPDFREACALLAEAFETEGHFDLAAGKLDEHVATFRPDHATAETYSRLAALWEQAGHPERALDVLEDLRRREPTFPNIAARIEALRKQRSAAGYGHLLSSGSREVGGGATAFVGDVRYELVEEIGRGGMGIVYRARDTRLDRIVALKRLPESLRRHHPRALQFFLREAQAAARLNHPNIVTVYDADQQDGQFFITMELLEGQPLQTVLLQRGQLSASNVLGIARQACRGLDYAHGQGIVHRDIKTANLFVTAESIVKIMDFGLAKVLEEVRGATTLVSGTPYYMSPEQVLGGDVDHRTDLYSLGVTLFELATGSVPFNTGEVAYHHRHSPVPDPRSLRPDLPEPLARLILQLLEKEPADRLQTAAAVLESLTRIDPERPS